MSLSAEEQVLWQWSWDNDTEQRFEYTPTETVAASQGCRIKGDSCALAVEVSRWAFRFVSYCTFKILRSTRTRECSLCLILSYQFVYDYKKPRMKKIESDLLWHLLRPVILIYIWFLVYSFLTDVNHRRKPCRNAPMRQCLKRETFLKYIYWLQDTYFPSICTSHYRKKTQLRFNRMASTMILDVQGMMNITTRSKLCFFLFLPLRLTTQTFLIWGSIIIKVR